MNRTFISFEGVFSLLSAKRIGLIPIKFWVVDIMLLFLLGSCTQLSDDPLRSVKATTIRDTAFIKHEIEFSRLYAGLNKFDSSFSSLNRALQISQENNYDKWLFTIYNEYSTLFNSSGNYSIAMEYSFKMLGILDEPSHNQQERQITMQNYAMVYFNIGLGYFNLDNAQKALEYYYKCFDLINKIYEVDSTYPYYRRMFVLYNSIGSVYLTIDNLDSASVNYKRALAINHHINIPLYTGSLYNNLGIVHKSLNEWNIAFDYYNQALEIRQELKDTAGIAQVYNNIGDAYFLTGKIDESIEVLTTALEYSHIAGNQLSEKKATNFLGIAYEHKGDYKAALDMQHRKNELSDRINLTEHQRLSSRLELQYQFEKSIHEKEVEKQLLVAKNQRKALIFIILSGILLSVVVILVLLYNNQKIKNKRNALLQKSLELDAKNLALEKQKLSLEAASLKQELDFRNKELATHVMYLLKKNEFIASIIDKLIILKPKLSADDKKLVQSIVKEMQSNVDNTVWGEFELRFQQVYSDFYERLIQQFPDLSPNEKKICAFLRLNMTTKDISAITFQSIKSIQVARARLRKKLNIDRDENLISFLQQI